MIEKTLSEKIIESKYMNKPILITEDVKEFIKGRKQRIENQLRIHWKWLKDKDYKEVADFVNNLINKGAGEELTK